MKCIDGERPEILKRKEILRQLKATEKENFEKALPLARAIFLELFDYVTENLDGDCDQSLTLTIEFLTGRGIENIDEVVEWIKDQGGYCDCEVLMNVHDKFE